MMSSQKNGSIGRVLLPAADTLALTLGKRKLMWLTFLHTFPPTAGLVAKFFGLANTATLFGIVMLSHQDGAFLGAWLGGKVFTMTGSYDNIWMIDIALAIGAALIHLPMKEAPVALKMQTA